MPDQGSLILALLCVYLVERLRPLVLRHIGSREQQAKGAQVIPLPVDLAMQAASFNEPWARADAEKRFRELYEDNGRDWDNVRVIAGGSGGSTSGH